MLNLGLSLLRFLEAYKIYTEFFPWQFVQNDHEYDLNLYIYLCLSLISLPDDVIFLKYESCRVYTSIGDTSLLLNPIY